MANKAKLKRPKVDEDEEELLRQQEEFLKTKQQSSAKVWSESLRKFDTEQDIVSTLQDSREMINPFIKDKIQETSKGKLEDMVQNIPVVSSNIILGNIVEKKFDIEKFDNDRFSTASNLGFPQVFTFDHTTLPKKRTSDKQSLFWQKFLKPTGSIDFSETDEDKFSHCNNKESSTVMKDQLATDFTASLAQMSTAEILEEKRKLEERLDPKIIEILKNRKSEKRPFRHTIKDTREATTQIKTEVLNDKMMKCSLNNHNTEMDCVEDKSSVLATMETTINAEASDKKRKFSSNDDTKMDCENDTLSIPQSSKKLLEESTQKGWLHMDALEPQKLEWMKDLLDEKKDESTPNEEYNARFDFSGLLLPYKDESLTIDKGLHHHGEEPERPGYSLQELLQLTRSSVQQQRCIALTTLANIMEKSRKGWYDKVLHPAPLIALSQKNILLLLRFSLDDPCDTVITAALQALRAFLVSEADEICLDRLFGIIEYIEPTLAPQLEGKDTSNLKDHELAQIDAVAALLRSDILLRIRYILNDIHLPSIGVICALEILIHLARHSHTAALNISFYLLDTIVDNFIPLSLQKLATESGTDNVHGIPVAKAIKLCRVLVTYGKKPVAQKLDNLKIIHTIITYANSEMGSSNKTDDKHRSIENLRLWQLLLHYGIGRDRVAGAYSTFIAQMKLWLDYFDIGYGSELDYERAAALIDIVSHKSTLEQIISSLARKWNNQYFLIPKPTWGAMKLCAMVSYAHMKMTTSEFGKEMSAFWLAKHHIFSRLCSDSNLLSNCNSTIAREPSCLPNLGVLTENGDLQPIVSINSGIPFLAKMATLDAFNCGYELNIRVIVENQNVFKYLQNLAIAEWNLERSWYSRTELHLLTTLVITASRTSDPINEETAQTVRKIAIKLVSALPADYIYYVKELLKIVLFNDEINTMYKLWRLDLKSRSGIDQVRISDLNAVLLYKKYIASNDNWHQAAMPKDWLFLPLVHIYTKCKSDVRWMEEDKNNILVVLELALTMPDLIETLLPTLIYSRLILVYLCDTVYLDEDISFLLSKVLSNLLQTSHARLNFRTELPGLTSFTDLFTALCEQFCACSYGNEGFAATLLVPLAQRHDVHYRKLLWSEHAAALHYMRLPLEKLLLPLTEYLYPEEEDTSLIDSYLTALIRRTITETCPIPFMIALHHAAMYLKRTNKLAARMRMQVEKLPNRDIANKLLSYEPHLRT